MAIACEQKISFFTAPYEDLKLDNPRPITLESNALAMILTHHSNALVLAVQNDILYMVEMGFAEAEARHWQLITYSLQQAISELLDHRAALFAAKIVAPLPTYGTVKRFTRKQRQTATKAITAAFKSRFSYYVQAAAPEE
eukprot:TRINITY_DN8907_c0_g1_i1.p1 TRINITY_DN8907_c0_g1~~TRINITY_DN8907_c0_g1_i1.p1  ORF type:complete len:140 (+),score=24.38 TRINITY_DN8907_c0_g1_i1:41-460(+)